MGADEVLENPFSLLNVHWLAMGSLMGAGSDVLPKYVIYTTPANPGAPCFPDMQFAHFPPLRHVLLGHGLTLMLMKFQSGPSSNCKDGRHTLWWLPLDFDSLLFWF